VTRASGQACPPVDTIRADVSDDPIWDEPARGSYPGPELLGLPGLARMGSRVRQMVPRPPIHHLFGLTPEESGPGYSIFSMPSSPWLLTTPSLYFAGVSALANDAPLGSAICRRCRPASTASPPSCP